MTWKEIKNAVEAAGIKEDDEIIEIDCERWHGDKILHKTQSGKMIKLCEHNAEEEVRAHGCAG